MDEKTKSSRQTFMRAGLLVGGALFADPSSALAMTGGRRFFGNAKAYEYPIHTPVEKLDPQITGADGQGKLILADFANIAQTDVGAIQKLGEQFPNITYLDLQANLHNSGEPARWRPDFP